MSLNAYQLTDLAVNGLVAAIEGKSEFLGTVKTRLSKDYAREGLDVGQTIRVVLPPRPNPWIDGRVIDPQATEYEEVSVTVIQKNTSRVISDAELQLDRREFFEECVKPDVNGGVREAEINALAGLMIQPAMADIDSVGQDPANSRIWNQIRAKGKMMLMPNQDIMGVMNPLQMAALADNEAKIFGPASIRDVAALDGRVRELVGVGKFYDSVNLPTQTNGTGDKLADVLLGGQTGTSLNIDGAGTGSYLAGQQFYFSDATVGFALDPEKHFALPFKQVFTLTQDCPITAGAATLVFQPAIIITGSLMTQLVAPPNNAVVTFLGDPSGIYPQSMMYGGEAIDFVGLNLPTFDGRGGVAKMKKYKEVPLRSVYFTDYKAGQNYLRYDQMTGIMTNRWQHVWRQWGARVG
jgi:hypothetical protein